MKRLVQYLVLPEHISEFERKYLARMNRVGLWFFALHVPAFFLVALLNHQSGLQALALSALLLAGPLLAYSTLANPRSVGVVYGFTSMLMGGLLVHLGQGPVQIEMHFYFFALLPMLAVYANPIVVLVAAVTVAVHHLAFWSYLPHSVFNYDAPFWVVLVHAGFVVLESIATCFIARSFFDNVIGLEKIVQARTEQLAERHRDMRLVLDNVHEGLFTIDREGRIASEQSRAIVTWFGPAAQGIEFADYMEQPSAEFAGAFRAGLEQVNEGILPLDMAIHQLPKRFEVGLKHFGVEYKPIMHGDELASLLVVVSDITADVERERLEREQRDVLAILERVAADRPGVLEFFAEGHELVRQINDSSAQGDLSTLRRSIHTLKGNSLMFGVQAIGELCHHMEDEIDETSQPPNLHQRTELQRYWDDLCLRANALLGGSAAHKLELEEADVEALLSAVMRGESRESLAKSIMDWRLEPTERRLHRIGEQAQGIARRLGKGELQVEIASNGLRTAPERWAGFWSAFVHATRNAVDHGIESPEERTRAGKNANGRIRLVTRVEQNEFVVMIQDDGRGIDWGSVASQAKERGLPHATHADLVHALFCDGLTTKQEASDYSGRGVGLGALRAICEDRGGQVRVHSEKDRGTSFEFRFPVESIQPVVSLRAVG